MIFCPHDFPRYLLPLQLSFLNMSSNITDLSKCYLSRGINDTGHPFSWHKTLWAGTYRWILTQIIKTSVCVKRCSYVKEVPYKNPLLTWTYQLLVQLLHLSNCLPWFILLLIDIMVGLVHIIMAEWVILIHLLKSMYLHKLPKLYLSVNTFIYLLLYFSITFFNVLFCLILCLSV